MNPPETTSLVKAVGVAALLHSYSELLDAHATGDGARQGLIDEVAAHVVTSSPVVFAAFLGQNQKRLLDAAPELAVDLCVRALARSGSDSERDFLQAFAGRHGLNLWLTDPDHAAADGDAGPAAFTAAQTAAIEHLRGLARLHFARPQAWGIKLRSTGWVVGPSGCGKTHLMRHLAQELGLNFLPIAIGSWTPLGARNGTPTLQVIRRHLTSDRKAMLFIDEFEKFRGNDGSTWNACVLGELLSLLEYQPGGDWLPAETRRLRNQVWITAAATYQDLWQEARSPLGFGTPVARNQGDRVLAQVRSAGWIPEELLFRLADPPALLLPYTAADFRGLCASRGIPDGVVDIEAAVASGLNMRALENALTAHAIRELNSREVGHAH